MLRGRLAGIGTLVDRHQPHQAHQPLHPLAVDRVVLRVQPCRHPPRAVERPGQVLPVDQRHQLQVRVADRRRATIDRGPADVQEPALTGHRQGGMRAVDHRAARGPAYLPSLLAKKSFSTLSWPICRYNSPTCASPPLSSRTPPASKTTAAPSSNIFFQLWIWFGCTSYSSASSAIVRSPLSAATATFALNEALCFFRVCFTSCSFSSAGYRNGTLITPPVSFPGTSSPSPRRWILVVTPPRDRPRASSGASRSRPALRAPAACWWARTTVLSIKCSSHPTCPVASAKA